MSESVTEKRGAVPAFFRFRPIGDRVLVTNREGEFAVLTRPEFELLRSGQIEPGTDLHLQLRARNFLLDGFDRTRASELLSRRKSFVGYGPNLHIMVVTLRCNQTCLYCHASRAGVDAAHTDMTPEIAERSVDLAMSSTSPNITIEFQGGEPLLAFDAIKHLVGYALERGQVLGKLLEFTLVTNLTLMDDEKLRWLLDRRVQICSSVDGPAHLHDRQRKLAGGGSSHAQASHWIRRINEHYAGLGLDPTLYHVEALLTTTCETLPLWKEVVDAYADLDCRALFLRPVDPFGFATRTAELVGYPIAEYLQFYRNAVDYMIELNVRGVEILERYASIFLTKILKGDDPNYLDIRNPCGAGIGQVAYNYDGRVFTCDEGRMLHEEGDDTFQIGIVGQTSYREIVSHETVRAIALASNLDAQPDCVDCTYQPYCGTCPVYNHKTQGTLFGRMRENMLCAVHKGIQDYLFTRIGEGNPDVLRVLEQWTTARPRTHFLQTGVA